MKCANCGNTDKKTLFDEGDTIYCLKCCHRTQAATGQDDLIICHYCGRLRDRKAYYCMWCNTPMNSVEVPSKKEYKELDKELSDYEKRLTPSDIRYWKLRGKKKR